MSIQPTAIIESPAPPIEVPSTSTQRYIRERARQWRDKIAIVDAPSGRTLSYGELDQQIGRFAAGVAALGFKPGDTLLIFAPNVPEWPVAALGALAAGGIVSGANPMSVTSDLAHQMHATNTRFVFTVAPLRAVVREAAAQLRDVKVIVLGDAGDDIAYASLLACTDLE